MLNLTLFAYMICWNYEFHRGKTRKLVDHDNIASWETFKKNRAVFCKLFFRHITKLLCTINNVKCKITCRFRIMSCNEAK